MTEAAQSSDDLLFIQVGGTIDKDYPAGKTNHGYEFEIGAPAYRSVLARVKFPAGWAEHTLMQMDSSDLQDAHRAEVRAAVEAVSQTRIIITHGTDTMAETAAALIGIAGKTIVLTGAMLPEKFRDSDADFNLGMAIAAARFSPPGVYVALNGTVTPAA
jgi:L-asparaginase